MITLRFSADIIIFLYICRLQLLLGIYNPLQKKNDSKNLKPLGKMNQLELKSQNHAIIRFANLLWTVNIIIYNTTSLV